MSKEAAKKIDTLIDSLPDWRGKLFAEIRAAVLATDKRIEEEWKWMGSPVWCLEGNLAVCNAHKAWVRMTFPKGAALKDPDKIFNTELEGNVRRAIKWEQGDKLDKKALQAMLKRAIEANLAKPAGKPKAKKKA